MSIPLLIGVVGHRHFPEEYREEVAAELSEAIDEIRLNATHTPIFVASSLAVGADRIGAHVALSKNLDLIAPLPFEPEIFEQDFPDTVEEFRSLLLRAKTAFVATEAGFSGYEGASRWIARHCQIVIALWDGKPEAPEPGGTAHTVRLRHSIGEPGHTLSNIADYLGPVLHVHCPRDPGQVRHKPRWIWPIDRDAKTTDLKQLLRPVNEFNCETCKLSRQRVAKSLQQLPEQSLRDTRLGHTFALADSVALGRQRRYLYSLNASVLLAIVGYMTQQIWTATAGKVMASILLTMSLLVIYVSNHFKDHDRYLEYRALAEVLRIACFWRLAGLSFTPTDRFLNQHWGNLNWVRGAVNALWMHDLSVVPNLELVKTYWIDHQQSFYENRARTTQTIARCLRRTANACFAASVLFAWLSIFGPAWGSAASIGSGILLLLVGAVTHYSHSRGWEEDAARYTSMAAPFSWCQKIWRCCDAQDQKALICELGGECIAEISNWLLNHRNRSLSIIRA